MFAFEQISPRILLLDLHEISGNYLVFVHKKISEST